MAIKKEITSSELNLISLESIICTALSHERGFPRFYDFEIENRKDIMAQSLLELSLNKLFQFYGNIFDDYTIANIGLQIIDRIQSMHKLNISHNDIKPSNIIWGRIINSTINDRKTLYCIDFGKASKIRINIKFNYQRNNKSYYNILSDETNKNYRYFGTSLFAPISIIERYYPTKKNDLVEMIYTLLYLIIG